MSAVGEERGRLSSGKKDHKVILSGYVLKKSLPEKGPTFLDASQIHL